MKVMQVAWIALLSTASSALGQARIIITEIMYNPNSNERAGETEWVEIANVGSESIDMKDWLLDDEDRNEWGKFSCTLAPGKVAVLVNAKAVNVEQFRAAWDLMSDSSETTSRPDYQVIPVQWGGISNSPSKDNEVLRLLNEKNEVVCEVKQEGEWPSCEKPDGPSIALVDLAAANISNGALWRRSIDGQQGARTSRKTEIFNGIDIGSPGFIPATTTTVSKPDAAPEKSGEKPGEKPEPEAGQKIEY